RGRGRVKGAGRRLGSGPAGRSREGTAPRLFDACLDRREAIGATRHQRDRRSLPRQQLGKAHAEPARGAGDERDAAFDVEQFRCSHRLCLRAQHRRSARPRLRSRRRGYSSSATWNNAFKGFPMAEHDHHEHGSELSETQLRVRALETVLTEKGYIDPAALDLIVEAFETKIGPHAGARVVAKAWRDPAF